MVLGLFTDLIVYHLGYFRYVPKVAGSHCGQVQYRVTSQGDKCTLGLCFVDVELRVAAGQIVG